VTQDKKREPRVANVPSEPPMTPIPQLFKKGYEAILPSKKGDVVVIKKPTPPPPDPFDTYKKSMQWRWWLLGVAGALIAFGFYVSEHLTNYEKKSEALRLREEHNKLHQKMDKRLDDLTLRLTDIRLEQVRQAEEGKLLDVRLELLMKVTSNRETDRGGRRVDEIETERLKREVRVQQSRLERLERDPRIRRAMPDDLDTLNL
jgi:hypothetical protein